MPFVNGRRVKTKLAAVDSVGSSGTGITVTSQNSQSTLSSEDDGTVNAQQYAVERPDDPGLGVSYFKLLL